MSVCDVTDALSTFSLQKNSEFQKSKNMKVESDFSKDIPELQAGCVSHYLLGWISHYLSIGSSLTEKDIPPITPERI